MPAPAESVVRRGCGALAGSAGKVVRAAARVPAGAAPLAAVVMAAAAGLAGCYMATRGAAGKAGLVAAEPVGSTVAAVAPAEAVARPD
jgi:hypothetical protein